MILSMLPFEKDFFSIAIFVHHIVGFVALLWSCNYSAAMVSSSALSFEASTPFVNTRWLLVAAELRESHAYLINGLLMLGVFFFARICYGLVYFWFTLLMHFDRFSDSIPIEGLVMLLLACGVATFLNTLWFSKMVKGAMKVFFAKEASDSQKKAD